MLGVPAVFAIDPAVLDDRMKQLQRQLHPDKFVLCSEQEKEISAARSSEVNAAFRVLKQPLARAATLLEIHGDPITEGSHVDDMEFLMETFEMNEAVEDCEGDADAAVALAADIQAKVDAQVEAITVCFDADDLEGAKSATIKLRYYSNSLAGLRDALPVRE